MTIATITPIAVEATVGTRIQCTANTGSLSSPWGQYVPEVVRTPVCTHALTVKYSHAPGSTTATSETKAARMRIREEVMRIDR